MQEKNALALIVLYLAMAIAAFGSGMAFNTCVNTAMSNTDTGTEGATSTSLGIISSLSIGLISGLGGAVLNFGERQGFAIANTLDMIWLITVGCALIVCLMLMPKIRRLERKKQQGEPSMS